MMKTLYKFLFSTLRGRLIVGVALVHAVMMALFIGDLTIRQRAMLLDRQVEEATALSQTLAISAAGWIAADDIAGLQELVESQRRYPEILFVIITDKQGRVLADTDNSRQGLYMLDLPHETRMTLLSRTPAVVDVATPAMIGVRNVGWARVGIGQKTAGEKLSEITRSGIVYALAAILTGSLIAWFMGRRITRRLYAVQETIGRVHAGDRLARSQLTGYDEAALLASEFNSMLDALAERDANLHASQEALYKREGELKEAQRLAHIGSWDWDALNDTIWWSDEYYRIYGFDPQQPPPNYAEHQKAYTHESAERLDVVVKRTMETGEPYEVDLELAQPATGTEWIVARGEAKRNASGKIWGLRGTAQNITERKAAEETLHLQAAELEEEVAERQMAQESLQEKALLLEEEIEKRQKAQDDLEKLNESLEQRVGERTAELAAKNLELQKMNRLFVGRELRMVELKKRIKELEATK